MSQEFDAKKCFLMYELIPGSVFMEKSADRMEKKFYKLDRKSLDRGTREIASTELNSIFSAQLYSTLKKMYCSVYDIGFSSSEK